jgi:hypothetical protein
MSYDVVQKHACIEIEFCVDNCLAYQESWLGKTLDKDNKKPVYWFGLTKDGLNAYDYDSFEQLINAKVFYDKSIKEIWDSVTLYAIDGCYVEERLPFYLP